MSEEALVLIEDMKDTLTAAKTARQEGRISDAELLIICASTKLEMERLYASTL